MQIHISIKFLRQIQSYRGAEGDVHLCLMFSRDGAET